MMQSDTNLSVGQRLATLFQSLGIQRAHIGANMPEDFQEFARSHSQFVSSLTLVCPLRMTAKMIDEIGCPILAINGERGPARAELLQSINGRSNSKVFTLPGYEFQVWSDMAADRTREIEAALLAFLNNVDQQEKLESISPDSTEGVICDISFRVRGKGPPLILLPLSLAPSQWEPLIPELSKHYCTIELSGRVFGVAAYLENRGRAAGYQTLIQNLLDALEIQPTDHVLEIGCGTGVIARQLGQRRETYGAITAIDINRHLLNEAGRLIALQHLDDQIQLQEGSVEAIPFPDHTFDCVICCTVLEEVDAGRAMAEIVRVTKPGGRVALAVRAEDMPRFINLPLPATLKARLEAPGAWGGGAATEGCADASLYDRLRNAGLMLTKISPQLVVFDGDFAADDLNINILPLLNPTELSAWQSAMTSGREARTFFLAYPFHCAVGSKPHEVDRF